MMGWRARIGFLVPPGNPTVEPEMAELSPAGVSVHFTRMSASAPAGTHDGQEGRNRTQVASLDEAARLLAMTAPQVIVLAHTATSYTLGRKAKADLVRREEAGAVHGRLADEHRRQDGREALLSQPVEGEAVERELEQRDLADAIGEARA